LHGPIADGLRQAGTSAATADRIPSLVIEVGVRPGSTGAMRKTRDRPPARVAGRRQWNRFEPAAITGASILENSAPLRPQSADRGLSAGSMAVMIGENRWPDFAPQA